MPSASTSWRGVKFQRRADAGRRPHGAEHRGRMKAGLVGERRRHGREPAHGLDADRDAEERRAAIELVPLAGRQHGRHDHRAGMHRAALERVVEILAVDRGAVDHRRAGGRQRAGMTDGGARPVILAGRERGAHVILVARGDREADHVDQQLLALAPHGFGQARRVERADFLREMFGDGDFGEVVGGHERRAI